MTKTIVIALGGNAIKNAEEAGTAQEQLQNIRVACGHIVDIIRCGYSVIITHGNGPQAGNLLIQQEDSRGIVPAQPMDIVGAMTEGQIGYMLQQSLANALRIAKLKMPVATILTQVTVDENDPEFQNPSKPVGPFYEESEIDRLVHEKGYIVRKVKPTGKKTYRRVVPSPEPIFMIEEDTIKRLVRAGHVVIAAGGGGIPVFVKKDGDLEGVEAIVDKDLAGEKLAEVVSADILLILTDVEKVKLHYGKPNERTLDRMTLKEAERYLQEGHFLTGSMGPKIVACLRFLRSGGEKAIIASTEKAVEALEGRTGTLVYQG
jgi:carbamate kinase